MKFETKYANLIVSNGVVNVQFQNGVYETEDKVEIEALKNVAEVTFAEELKVEEVVEEEIVAKVEVKAKAKK